MILRNKKGISPVIATTLLILIAVIIALIIFWWVKAFFAEQIQKNNEAIENFCDSEQLQFSANVISDGSGNLTIEVQNSGNIPINGIQVKKKGFASVKDLGSADFSEGVLTSGLDGTVSVEAKNVVAGDKVRIVAVLMGEIKDGTKKKYACSKNYVEAEVTA